MTKLRSQSKRKGFKNLLPEDELKQFIVKQPSLTRAQSFGKAGIERVKKDKRCKILYELGSLKKSPFTKANVLKHQN